MGQPREEDSGRNWGRRMRMLLVADGFIVLGL